jgi:hypothetical protein
MATVIVLADKSGYEVRAVAREDSPFVLFEGRFVSTNLPHNTKPSGPENNQHSDPSRGESVTYDLEELDPWDWDDFDFQT